MHVDLQNEKILSLKDAAKAIPRLDGKKPHTSTIWRWCVKGLNGVRLESLRVGNRCCTTHEALSRFFHRLSEVEHVPTPRPRSSAPPRDRTDKQRAKDIAKAEAELDAA